MVSILHKLKYPLVKKQNKTKQKNKKTKTNKQKQKQNKKQKQKQKQNKNKKHALFQYASFAFQNNLEPN